MLERLTITDFAVARSVIVEPGSGLNVFTGETGAGKSLIVDALAFASGARRGREVITTGAAKATVEARLSVGGVCCVVERSVGLSGRTTARLGDDPATTLQIQEVGSAAFDIHGQSEQLAILRPSEQLAVLDAFAGVGSQRDLVAATVRALRDARRQLQALATDSRERERLIEQLTFETNEIGAAALTGGEDEALRSDQLRLSSVRRLREEAAAAIEGLDAAPLGDVVRAVSDITARDDSAAELGDIAALLETAASDLGRQLRRYAETLEDDPERLAVLEERLDTIARLRRKYGDTIADILAYESSARGRLEGLTGTGASLDELRDREANLLAVLATQSADLSQRRRDAASALVGNVAAELAELGMGGAALAIGFGCEDDPHGPSLALPDFEVVTAEPAQHPPVDEALPRAFGESGVDRVEFLASFNTGETPRPLGAVASGGETSRFLLALTTVLGNASAPRTIVLDEVDEGVGGRAGSLVGAALQRLAQRHQVLCITHLPQVAAYGARHFVVSKESDGVRSWSEIHEVVGDARIDELASMLGAITPAARETAREMLGAVPTVFA